jgi:hypothetical protein
METSKKFLKTVETVPPGGWKYIDPDSKLEILGTSFDRLKDQVLTHRTYLGNDTTNYPDEIEHQICSRIPESWVQDEPRPHK